jgi:hypothetical protein
MDPLPHDHVEWLVHFQDVMDLAIATHQWTRLLNSFIQLGVVDPLGPIDDPDMDPELQRIFNRRAYNILNNGALRPLRKALQADLKTTNPAEEGLEEYGRISLKSYSIELLQNFLVQEPSWI